MLRLSIFNKLPLWMALSSMITILVGFRMLYIVSGGFKADFFSSNYGICLSVGALCAISALIYGITVNRPIGIRLDKLAKEIPAGEDLNPEQLAEAQLLFGNMGNAVKVIAFLLAITIILIVIAKYV